MKWIVAGAALFIVIYVWMIASLVASFDSQKFARGLGEFGRGVRCAFEGKVKC